MQYIQDQCQNKNLSSDTHCRKLFSHFLGTFSHILADNNFDSLYVTEVAKREFSGSVSKAQQYLDPSLDVIALHENRERLGAFPEKWVPWKDLQKIYRRMNIEKSQEEIEGTVSFQYWIIIIAKRITVPYLYERLKKKSPWGASNYLHAPGGVNDTAQYIAQQFNILWNIIENEGIFFTEIPTFFEEGNWPHTKLEIRR